MTRIFTSLISLLFSLNGALALSPTEIECGNLVYGGKKTSVCFADKFLETVAQETNLGVVPKFQNIQLDAPRLFDHPFIVFSGEDNFELSEEERSQLRRYLLAGGFILASPSCSNEKWDKAFRRELKICFPELDLSQIPMTAPIFSTVYTIDSLVEKKGKPVLLEGLEVNGRIALIYSKEGLNDVGNAKGCCCCGGNEIRDAIRVNVNIFTYALLY